MSKFIELSKELIEAKKKVEILTEQVKEERTNFIEQNKPCDKGDLVEIVLASGRKVKGVVNGFGILQDFKIYVTSYTDKGSKYITEPHGELTVIQKNFKPKKEPNE